MADPSLDWLISVDDHILEPPDLWVDRVPAKDRDRAPRMVRDGGDEYWLYEDKRMPSSGLSACAGKSKEEFSPEPVSYDEMRPGCYDAKARIEDMDRAGVLASLCFPTLPRFCGQLFYEAADREFGFVCLQTYNDWMIDEWCQAAPGRYIPLILIPIWDPPLAAKEMERCAAKGADRVLLLGEPRTPRAADDPRRQSVLGSGDGCGVRSRDDRVHARRLVVPGPDDRPRLAVHGEPGLGSQPHLRHDALVAVQRAVHPLPEPQDRAVGG